MTNFIDDMMDFNPVNLTIFNDVPVSDFNQNIYKTNPKDSKSEDGHYRSKIRILYNPFDNAESIVKQTTYAMNDADGFFMVKSKLANGDRECPIFKSWKKLWFSEDEDKKDWARKMYEKSESQWCLVQIIEDDNKPEMVGQIKAMKLPKAIFVKLEALIKPAAESKKSPVPVMDYIFGRALEMDVTPGPDDPAHPERKQREIKYDLCVFENDPTPIIKVDGTPLFTDEELELIDTINNACNDYYKAKTDKKKQEAAQIIADNKDARIALKTKATDYMMANCIDIVKECAYQPWDEATEKRVQNWIDIVATMNDPKTVSSNDTVPQIETTTVPTEVDPFMGFDNTDNGMPF